MHTTQLQTAYQMASKSFLYSNAFMAKSGPQTLSLTLKSVTDSKQTDQKNSTFLVGAAVDEIRAPPNVAR